MNKWLTFGGKIIKIENIDFIEINGDDKLKIVCHFHQGIAYFEAIEEFKNPQMLETRFSAINNLINKEDKKEMSYTRNCPDCFEIREQNPYGQCERCMNRSNEYNEDAEIE
jgi:hypothetical protein